MEPLLQDEVSGVKSRMVVGQLAVICLGVLRKKCQDLKKKKEEKRSGLSLSTVFIVTC